MADRINYWFYNSRAQRFSAVLAVKIVCCDVKPSSVVENCGRFGGTRYKFLWNFDKLLPGCTVSRFRQQQYSVHGSNNYITESFFFLAVEVFWCTYRAFCTVFYSYQQMRKHIVPTYKIHKHGTCRLYMQPPNNFHISLTFIDFYCTTIYCFCLIVIINNIDNL